MMFIDKYGIRLSRLIESDIELVRIHRNSEQIKSKMFFRDHITPEMQQTWFHSINNIFNYYFLVEINQITIGMIHGKIRSFSDGVAEGGIFVWDEKWSGSPEIAKASLIMMQFTFELFKMKKTYAEVRADNPTALAYNLKLGYVIEEQNDERILISLDQGAFTKSRPLFQAYLQSVGLNYNELIWENVQFKDVSEKERELWYIGFPDELQFHVNKCLINYDRKTRTEYS